MMSSYYGLLNSKTDENLLKLVIFILNIIEIWVEFLNYMHLS